MSCNITSKTKDTKLIEKESPIVVTIFFSDDNYKFEIKNNSDTTITIYNPKIKTIEKLENKNWELQRILYCPCGARCQPAQKRMQLLPDESVHLQWNLYETWCDNDKNGNLVPKKNFAGYGKYRIKIKYEKEKNKILTHYKEFDVVE